VTRPRSNFVPPLTPPGSETVLAPWQLGLLLIHEDQGHKAFWSGGQLICLTCEGEDENEDEKDGAL
jgi:hypothetical protein